MHRNALIKVSAGILTLILVAILFTQVTINDIVCVILTLDPFYLFLSSTFYISSYFFRTLRFHLLLNQDVSMNSLFTIVCVHNMMNNLLPARTGELSYVYLLRKTHGKNIGTGLATLVIARFFDFIIIGLIFLVTVITLRQLPDTAIQTSIYALLLIAVSVLLIIILFKSDNRKIAAILERALYRLKLDKTSTAIYILGKFHETAESFGSIRRNGMSFHFKVLASSIGIWSSLYIFYFCMAIAMHMDVDFFSAIFASSFAVFTTVLPIQGIGGFGTIEGGWTLGFILIGVPESTAIASAFSFHLVMLVNTLILGIGGYLVLMRRDPIKQS